jgi:CheY-like chemotaxis protein
VVEDDDLTAMVIRVMLREAGHEVLGPVKSASEALTLAEKQRPEIAIADVHLSGIGSGIELAKLLRDQWSIPTLLVSGSSGDIDAACEAAIAFLDKPFDVETLIASLEAIECIMVGGVYSGPYRLKLGRAGPWAVRPH